MSDASQAAKPLISVREVTKLYRDGQVQALNSVSLEIPEGSFTAIMGPSGCGKSTLLYMLGALDRPTTGEVFFHGKPLASLGNLDQLRAQQFGFVFQSFYLLPNLTAVENVQLPMFGGKLSPQQRVAAAEQLLDQVGLSDRRNHLPEQLSNGQRQRVAIARAISNQPAVIFADEPTGALDSKSGDEVMELLSKLNNKLHTTLVIVTHDPAIAARAQRTIQMLDGRIVD